MAGEVEEDHESKGVHTSIGYLQRTIRAILTIWLSLTMVIIAVFGLSECLRVARLDKDENVLITFLVGLGLSVLALWLLSGSLLTVKEERQDGGRQRYIQDVVYTLSGIWAILATLMIVAIGLYAVLRMAGVEGDKDLLITFVFALGLILLALYLLPGSLLTLKEEKRDDRGG